MSRSLGRPYIPLFEFLLLLKVLHDYLLRYDEQMKMTVTRQKGTGYLKYILREVSICLFTLTVTSGPGE